jgi:hypothetical protein
MSRSLLPGRTVPDDLVAFLTTTADVTTLKSNRALTTLSSGGRLSFGSLADVEVVPLYPQRKVAHNCMQSCRRTQHSRIERSY